MGLSGYSEQTRSLRLRAEWYVAAKRSGGLAKSTAHTVDHIDTTSASPNVDATTTIPRFLVVCQLMQGVDHQQ